MGQHILFMVWNYKKYIKIIFLVMLSWYFLHKKKNQSSVLDLDQVKVSVKSKQCP